MFPNAYYPYNEGTLMSMSVNEVERLERIYLNVRISHVVD